MALFVVKHQHPAERCPAKDPKMGQMLLQHVSKENSAKMGVNIHADAVLDGKHTFYLILDSANEAKVKQFMTPFSMAGSVEITQANPCDVVVNRLGC